MARFIGTYDDFKKYFEATTLKIVQNMAKPLRDSVGKCMCCGTKRNPIDFAHNRDNDRAKIVKTLLQEHYMTDELGVYDVKLDEFVVLFEKAHEPIQSVGYVLCRSCHKKYDGNKLDASEFNDYTTNSLNKFQAKINKSILRKQTK